MRFMHIGRQCHVVGEATTPSIRQEDGLIVVSGSGKTATSVRQAEAARREGAIVASVTRTPESPLALLSDVVLRVPVLSSSQLGGDLFEQSALILLDSAANALGEDLPNAAAELRLRHANLQ
jgi:6-phospho-3-hexuloisomerase